VSGEVLLDLVGDVEVFGRQAESLASGLGELGSAFAVAASGTRDFGNAASDLGLGDDDLRTTVVVGLGRFVDPQEGRDVVTIDRSPRPSPGPRTGQLCRRSGS
jgi:hypothetical protein